MTRSDRSTAALIDRLAAQAAPVRRLSPPWLRALAFLALAAAVLGAWALIHGTRPDLAQRLADPMFRMCVGASLASGMAASLSALTLALPDRSRLWALLPLPCAALWLGSISYGSLMDWVVLTPDGWQAGMAVTTFTTLILGSVVLSAAMFWLLRFAGRLRPSLALAQAGLAVSALTACAISVLHKFDASVLVLAWNLGMTVLVVTLETWLGRRLLRSRLYDDSHRLN